MSPRPRVLMLGWEFPPVINGGLGIACLGMGKALSKFADLSFILPKADPHFVVANLDLLGLNDLTAEDIERIDRANSVGSFGEMVQIQANLSPYDADDPDAAATAAALVSARMEADDPFQSEPLSKKIAPGVFKIDDLYGNDVDEKVVEFAQAAATVAEHKKFDIIHAHDWMTFPAALEIKKRSGKPLVLHIHSLSYDRGGPDSRGRTYDLEKRAMEEADVIIPVSNYTASIITTHYGIDSSKIAPVHNGAEPVEAFRSERPFPEKVVLFLGRLTAQKGPEFFLQVASKVLKRNKNVRFIMAGTGDKLKQLIEFMAFQDVGDRFHFTGFLNKEKVNHLLSITDVYCMPSVSEPFGLSALEAAQFDIPAVISKQSGVAEVLRGALKADYWDVDLMAEHILTLLEQPEAHASAVAACREDQKNCTWDRAAERIMQVYAEQGLIA